jgi:hypothetical protein
MRSMGAPPCIWTVLSGLSVDGILIFLLKDPGMKVWKR